MQHLDDSMVESSSEHIGQLLHSSITTQEVCNIPDFRITSCLGFTSSSTAEQVFVLQYHPSAGLVSLDKSAQADSWTPSRVAKEAQADRSDLGQQVVSEVGAYLSSHDMSESSSFPSQVFEVEQPRLCTRC